MNDEIYYLKGILVNLHFKGEQYTQVNENNDIPNFTVQFNTKSSCPDSYLEIN